MNFFEWIIAFRYLRSKRREGFISIIAIFSFIGIALGVATLIVVMSVMKGFRTELMERIIGINSHITLFSNNREITDYQDKIEKISKIDGIKIVNPLVNEKVIASYNNEATGAMVRGINYNDLKKKPLIADNVLMGDLKDFATKDNILIGGYLARSLGVTVGDSLTLISPQSNRTVVGMIPRLKDYKIAGIFEMGMYEYDSTTIFMPLKNAQIHFRYPETVGAIEITIDNIQNSQIVVEKLKKLVKENGWQIRVVDWREANSNFLNALDVERTVMFLILTLIIIVAAFNIISSLVMLVNDKSKNIALLRTMGATKGSVIRIFVICGSLIGVVGTILGSFLGILFAANIETIRAFLQNLTGTTLFDPVIYYLTHLPAELDPKNIILIIIMSLLLSLLATIYPAWKASKLHPAQVLRYE